MSEYNECYCESASTNPDSICENGPEMSLEEGKVNSEERRELEGKKCMSSIILQRDEITYIPKASYLNKYVKLHFEVLCNTYVQ